MNSRYWPGERTDDWLKLSLRAEAPGSFVAAAGRAGRSASAASATDVRCYHRSPEPPPADARSRRLRPDGQASRRAVHRRSMPTGSPRCGASAPPTSWSGIPSFGNAETIGYVVRATTAGMVQYFPELKPILVNSDGGSPDDTPRVAVSTESPDYLEKVILVSPKHKLQRISFTYQGISGKGTAVRALFEVARELKVKAMVMVDSDLRSIVPEWVELLAGPILKGGYDYVAPLYARYKYDGTITNNISYPLTRALYGARIRQPIGGDFGVSGDLVSALPGARHVRRADRALRDRHLDDALGHQRGVRRLPGAARRQDPRRQGPGLRPRTDVPPGGRHALQAGRPLRGPMAAASRLASRSRSTASSASWRPEEIAVNHAKLVDNFEQARLTQRDAWAEMLAPEQLERVHGARHGRRRRRLPLQRRAVDPLPVRHARRLPPARRRPRAAAGGAHAALLRSHRGLHQRHARDDDRPGGAGHRRPGAPVRGAQAVPRRRAGRGAREPTRAPDGRRPRRGRRIGSSCRSPTRGRRATSCASAPASPTGARPRSPCSASSRCPRASACPRAPPRRERRGACSSACSTSATRRASSCGRWCASAATPPTA